jgi:stromal interaction molecule 1
LTAIIGSWYAYQQNKNAKGHLKRMARDMEQLHKAEKELSKMQTELERARIEQENVGKEKMDLERRLKEAPIKNSNSEMELQQLKQEIELLRNELSRAEVELIDQHWQAPAHLTVFLFSLNAKFLLSKFSKTKEKKLLPLKIAQKTYFLKI